MFLNDFDILMGNDRPQQHQREPLAISGRVIGFPPRWPPRRPALISLQNPSTTQAPFFGKNSNRPQHQHHRPTPDADALYLVRSGRVRVDRQDEFGVTSELAELGSGATFGEMGLLFKRPRTATVTSVEATQLVKVPREVIEEVLKRSFHVGLALEGLASEREEKLR